MIGMAFESFITEAIKVRGTIALWLAVIVPLLAVVVFAVSLSSREASFGMSWFQLKQTGLGLWFIFFMPVLIFFEAAFLASLEHEADQWKQLLTFPIARWIHFATKMAVCALLLSASFGLFVMGFTADLIIIGDRRNLPFGLPWRELLLTTGAAFLASLPLVAIHTWLSIRFAGIVRAIGVGAAALTLGLMLIGTRGTLHRVFEASVLWWYPWTLPLRTLDTRQGLSFTHLASTAVIGSIGGVLLGALVCWDLARREEIGQ